MLKRLSHLLIAVILSSILVSFLPWSALFIFWNYAGFLAYLLGPVELNIFHGPYAWVWFSLNPLFKSKSVR